MACATPLIRSSALTEEIAVPTMFEKIWNRHVVTEGPGDSRFSTSIGTCSTRGRRMPSRVFTGRDARCGGPPASWPPRITTCPRDRDRRPSPTRRSAAWSRTSNRSTREEGVTLFGPGDARTGIVHVIGPEQGLTQPGITARLRRLAHRDPRRLRGASPSASAPPRSSTCSPPQLPLADEAQGHAHHRDGRAARRASRPRT